MKRLLIPFVLCGLAVTPNLHGQSEGETAPDFEVNLLGGSTWKLSDQSGKVVFVFLFGNTCPFCLASGPDIESRIYQEYKDDDRFTAIGLDTWDGSSSQGSVEAFRNSTGITFPLAVKAGSVVTKYKTTYDRLMVIDSEGILAHKGTVASSNDIGNARSAIEESLMVTGRARPYRDGGVRIFPNPVSDLLNLEWGDEAFSRVIIRELTGKQVMHLPIDGSRSGRITVPVGHLEEGLYFYTLTGEHSGGSRSGKLVIRR